MNVHGQDWQPSICIDHHVNSHRVLCRQQCWDLLGLTSRTNATLHTFVADCCLLMNTDVSMCFACSGHDIRQPSRLLP